MIRLVAAILVVSVFTACDSLSPVESADELEQVESASTSELDLVSLVNAARATARSCGASQHAATSPVTWNSKLATAAQSHSEDMAFGDFFSHTGSDGSTVADRVTATAYSWRTVGENIYGGYTEAERAMTAWLDSPGHCRLIMDPNFKEVGMAVVFNSTSTYQSYWTQVFGAQR
ncbi:MAG: CAP domain-containing protein [Rhodothermia bacterium]|nr:MAG: CAP domain-containing protein [Rhodothermia bacterium]